MRIGSPALALALAVSVAGNGLLLWRKMQERDYLSEPLVTRALDLHGRNASRAQLLKDYDPVVVYLPNMTCVGLNLKRGWAGGDTTYCFDENGNLVLDYLNGQ